MGAHQIILMCSLARHRRLMASVPLYDITVIHCSIVPTSLIVASCRLYSWSHRTTCSITANLSDLYTAHQWAVATSILSYIFIVSSDATPTLLWDYAAMKAVWDHTRSFLRHHCRLWLRHHADFTCGITADAIRCLIGQLTHIPTPVGPPFLQIMLDEHRLYVITTWHS
jgi:hypothetical protein